jgi:hypothetical protein
MCLFLIILASNLCNSVCLPDDVATGGAKSFRVMKSFSQQAGIQGGLGAAFPSHATFPHYAVPQGLPYHVYGYPSLSLSETWKCQKDQQRTGPITCMTCALWQATLVNGDWVCKLFILHASPLSSHIKWPCVLWWHMIEAQSNLVSILPPLIVVVKTRILVQKSEGVHTSNN